MRSKAAIAVLTVFLCAALCGCADKKASSSEGYFSLIESTTPATEEPVRDEPSPISAGRWLSTENGVPSHYYFFGEDKTGCFISLGNGVKFGFTYTFFDGTASFDINATGAISRASIEVVDEKTIKLNWENDRNAVLTLESPDFEQRDFYSDADLEIMALDFCEKNSGYRPYYAKSQINADGTVRIRLFDEIGGDEMTKAVYSVDRWTAKGTDELSGGDVAFDAPAI